MEFLKIKNQLEKIRKNNWKTGKRKKSENSRRCGGCSPMGNTSLWWDVLWKWYVLCTEWQS